MLCQSGCWSQVAYNPIALEFKEAGSHHAFKSLVENQATHHLGEGKVGKKPPGFAPNS
jgi:hypothetical protein